MCRSVCDKPPYQVTETGWGEFTVQIRLQFVAESGEKPLTLSHAIKLHHWGPPIEAPAPPPTSDPIAAPQSVDHATGGEEAEVVKAELETPRPQTSPPVPEATPAEAGAPGQAVQVAEAAPPQPVSIAAQLPVHAWQYDEIVFSDPPLSFLSMLNAAPPTPLPPKNRRARDQREAHDARAGKKTKGRTSSASVMGSRQGTTEPTAVEGTTAITGMPGELGSADVPLEFTLEMEKGEWNRLNDARVNIISEMDRWRWVGSRLSYTTPYTPVADRIAIEKS